jgi:hypothetical protein
MIVVLASLRPAALAGWNTVWETAVNFTVGRQVTTCCPRVVNQA